MPLESIVEGLDDDFFLPEQPGDAERQPSLAEADLPAQGFDLVTLWDVIEHSEDPGADLGAAVRLLKPGGRLFVQTPNASWVRFKVACARFLPAFLLRSFLTPYGLLLPEQHLQYYSLATLRRQLAACGCAMVDHFEIDWAEPAGSALARAVYALVFAQARLVSALTRGRWCSNIGLSVLARPADHT